MQRPLAPLAVCARGFVRSLTFGLTFRNRYEDSVCEIRNGEVIREGACTLMLANLLRGYGDSNHIQNVRWVVDRDSSVGIATGYGLDGPGIESQWGARFSAPVQIGPGAHPSSYTMGTGSLSRGWSGRCWPPTSSSVEVKERVELYLYSPSGPSWPVIGWALLYHYTA
jgi:hypothetical protein